MAGLVPATHALLPLGNNEGGNSRPLANFNNLSKQGRPNGAAVSQIRTYANNVTISYLRHLISSNDGASSGDASGGDASPNAFGASPSAGDANPNDGGGASPNDGGGPSHDAGPSALPPAAGDRLHRPT